MKSKEKKDKLQKIHINIGKTNYTIQVLIKKGIIKIESFFENKNQYRYILIKNGINATIELTEKI